MRRRVRSRIEREGGAHASGLPKTKPSHDERNGLVPSSSRTRPRGYKAPCLPKRQRGASPSDRNRRELHTVSRCPFFRARALLSRASQKIPPLLGELANVAEH
jgi:hypothetical protein